eukprot:NODE_2087_length_656_cov_92.275992_g2037_i0.p1 GENE.NODE_2087_length_656_cov_92.275992_g2037_i0~~NODE_2087_length_656_cov_92.275992_g2037_i0.p1  ORF type:complete len:189 (+),score=11.90 NODE_2087_length_656_cov_92.275992_g2037_i0:74-640(+)
MPKSQRFIDQVVFYSKHHSVLGNELVHLVFVPLLMSSAFTLAEGIPLLNTQLFTPLCSGCPCNTPLFFLFLAMYPLTYLYWDLIAGVSWLPMAAFCWWAHYWMATNLAVRGCIALQVVGWGCQFIAHGFIEKRAPSLFENVYDSFVMAPMFVWLTFVLFPLGYAPETRKIVQARVKEEQAAMDAKKRH